ncbi:kinase-like protein [Coprinellus micaceus]|uniref:Kinase-like protein n=1 Tax=Coprinellus micaceus TaxID=71717 RepID=A0A4Y7TRE3_COPMI|nr:kinase-like protein [Coprinellus micaceus]
MLCSPSPVLNPKPPPRTEQQTAVPSMSLKDLLSFAPVPALDTVVTLLTSTYSNIQKIGVYRKQCEDMFGRCCALLVKLREGGEGLEGSKALRLADELEPVLERITELKDDLDRLQRQLDGAILNFGAAMNLELQRTMYRSEAIHHATREEFRASLQAILDDQRELKKLFSDLITTARGGGYDAPPDYIPQEQHDSFQKGLWDLRSKTAKLPPLTDLTGQVELNDRHPEFIGTYNDVYKVRLPRTLSDTAVVHKKFQQESGNLACIRPSNVLPLYGIVYIGKHLYSVAPWMTYGTAISFVEKYPQTNVLKLLSEVTEGLGYLHSKGIVHGDLRGANVLISEDGVAKALRLWTFQILRERHANKGMTSAASINPRWQAPEIIREKPLSRESDIWSLAMTFLELLTRHQPTTKDQAAIDAGLNDELWELVKQCWKKPEDRPTVEDVKLSLARIRGEIAGRPPKGRMSSLLTIMAKHPAKEQLGLLQAQHRYFGK